MRSLLLAILLAGTTAVVIREVMPEGEATAREALAHAQEVQSISFDGQRLPILALRETLSTHVGDKLDGARLERDREALEASLVASGYLAAHVDAPVVTFGDGGAAFVTFAIAQGDMFHLSNVGVPRDAGVVTIGKGDEAVADRIERARLGVAERLHHKVTIRQAVDVAAATVDLELIAR